MCFPRRSAGCARRSYSKGHPTFPCSPPQPSAQALDAARPLPGGLSKFRQLGLSVAILGPTFQDLARNVNRNISSLSIIFVGRASGFLGGTLIGGVLLDYMNHFLLLGVSMLATTVGFYLIPFCKKAILLIVMMSVFGASAGVVDTGRKEI
ncbi:sodium-dependent glucose transporter 1A-like isoform X2 [Psammomys obesus]|uniref:sodium-dependent glucose transporter 1A-like isoform X2 n=1 Tax=Psammomys obesus TaxID=48139 RepID=UPI002452F168|nr:sodium-dependent glucose transporter 1A-like isoform X2 [Psammomys obesus]